MAVDDALPEVPALDPAAGPAWRGKAAEQLADWTLARLVNRTDRYGGYYQADGGPLGTINKPAKGAVPGCVTRALVLRHFRPASFEDVMGGHALTQAAPDRPSVGKWVGIDIDNHGHLPDIAERNRVYAGHLYAKLVALGFRPLLETWGAGGYHLWVLFDREVPGAVLNPFAQQIVADSAAFGFYGPVDGDPRSGWPEANPKKPSARFGNWLRFPGRHHKRDVWSVVFDGAKWVQGFDAVGVVLSCTGDSPDLIPPPPPAPPASRPSAPRPAGQKVSVPVDRPDVFAAYNREVTLDMVVAWHEQMGRHPVVGRSPTRVEFSREGAEEEKHRFNVELHGGVPVTYNFSPNAGIPHNNGLSPSQVRCFYERGACDKRTMTEFAHQLRRELGWAAEPAAPAGRKGGEEGPPADPEGAPAPAPDEFNGTPEYTDLANARRFVADHRDNVIYADDLKSYFVYDGVVWERDQNANVAGRLAQQTVRRMAVEAAERVADGARQMAAAVTEDEKAAAERVKKRAEADLKWAKASCNEKPIRNMVTLARSHLRIRSAGDVFDTDPSLLNCPNGTVDLRTGVLTDHRRADMITKLCPTRYVPTATAPAYHQFLESVLPDPDLAGYVRYLGGYAATGEVMDQSLVIFHGSGANGKTTLLELWVKVLGAGQYAVTAPPELVADKGETRHPVEKTVLRGARLAVCQETDDDEALNAKRVKALTGASRIQARGMRENFSDFLPTHKLFLATNPLPRVLSNDHATWRRVRITHFAVRFWTELDRMREPHKEYPPGLRADPLLPAKLAAEAEGVLADMVAQAVAFYANGMEVPIPPVMAKAVESYRVAEDYVGRFFESSCEDAGFNTGAQYRVKAGQFYAHFLSWFKQEVDPAAKMCPSPRCFYDRATSRFTKKTVKGTDYYAVIIRPPLSVVDDGKAEPVDRKEDKPQTMEGFNAILG